MAQDPRTVKVGQFFLAEAKFKDNEGKPIQPYQNEPPTWQSTKPNVISCDPSVSNVGFAECTALKLGDTQLIATANFDFGYGIHPSSLTVDITVAQYDQPQGEIELTYGSVGKV